MIRIEQVFVGELNGAHSVLTASTQDSIASEIASKLDLPDTAPPGVPWSSYISGFPHRDRYVLARTIPDPTASRAGMVFSHALVSGIQEINLMADLRPILNLFTTSPCRPTTAEGIIIEPTETASNPTSVHLIEAANALTAPHNGPVVLVGQTGFDELISALWWWLWPSIRSGLIFRLSFGPTDVIDVPPPSIVCTPVSLAARWGHHRMIGSATSHKALSPSADVLSGGSEREPMLRFAELIGAEIRDFRGLNLLEQAYRLRNASRFDELLAYVRLVQALSPGVASGGEIKRQVFENLCLSLRDAASADVLMLRNLQLSFVDNPDRLWKSLARWVVKNSFLETEDAPMFDVLENALNQADAIPEWREAVLSGISDVAGGPESSFPNAFWRLANNRPGLLKSLFEHLPTNSVVESKLAIAAPAQIKTGIADLICTLALSRNWLLLHGATVSAGYPPIDAARRQLTVDFVADNVAALRLALRLATPAQKLEAAMALNDSRTIQIASEEVAKVPALLSGVDFRPISTQQVWAGALAINKESWRGPANSERAVKLLLDRLLDGKEIFESLLVELSSSPLADVHDYERRPALWSALRGVTRDKFLQSTAMGLLHASEMELSRSTLEPELQQVILESPELNARLENLIPNQLNTALQLIGSLAQFSEDRFGQWLHRAVSRTASIALADAEVIGRLILSRSWRRALDNLVSMVWHGRNDLKSAVRICVSLLSLWKRLVLGVAELSSSEKWDLLEETAVELYPSGPDEKGLWQRAGGDDGDLVHYGTGRSRWHHVILQLQRGKRFDIGRLLHEMQRDFANNEKLKYLRHHVHLWGY